MEKREQTKDPNGEIDKSRRIAKGIVTGLGALAIGIAWAYDTYIAKDYKNYPIGTNQSEIARQIPEEAKESSLERGLKKKGINIKEQLEKYNNPKPFDCENAKRILEYCKDSKTPVDINDYEDQRTGNYLRHVEYELTDKDYKEIKKLYKGYKIDEEIDRIAKFHNIPEVDENGKAISVRANPWIYVFYRKNGERHMKVFDPDEDGINYSPNERVIPGLNEKLERVANHLSIPIKTQ